jgi:hypothetical protein
MSSKLALEYQEKKKNGEIFRCVQEPVRLLDQKFNCVRLLEIASNAVGRKCLSAEAVAAGRPSFIRKPTTHSDDFSF